jgi:hypothetical protein
LSQVSDISGEGNWNRRCAINKMTFRKRR